jgi:ribonuclease HI
MSSNSMSSAPASKSAASAAPSKTPPQPGMVWVNTDSKIYHKQGSRWYGNTKQGQWMTESDAQKAGYKASEK